MTRLVFIFSVWLAMKSQLLDLIMLAATKNIDSSQAAPASESADAGSSQNSNVVDTAKTAVDLYNQFSKQ